MEFIFTGKGSGRLQNELSFKASLLVVITLRIRPLDLRVFWKHSSLGDISASNH
jgi:hypothetical protein